MSKINLHLRERVSPSSHEQLIVLIPAEDKEGNRRTSVPNTGKNLPDLQENLIELLDFKPIALG